MTARKLTGTLILALAAACSSAEKPGTTSGTTTDGHGGATATTTTSSSTTLAVGGFGGFGGSGGRPCDPAPDPNSLWAQGAVPYTDPNPTTLCAYRGDVLLIVNTAAI